MTLIDEKTDNFGMGVQLAAVINGKEVTNPVAKTTLAFGAILFAALITAIIVSVLLPFVGVVVTLSVGFILSC